MATTKGGKKGAKKSARKATKTTKEVRQSGKKGLWQPSLLSAQPHRRNWKCPPSEGAGIQRGRSRVPREFSRAL